MIIEPQPIQTTETTARASARVRWETSDRPDQEVFVETVAAHAGELSSNPHAFLVACLLPAMRHGEHRLRIAAPVCPELVDGLQMVMAWIQHWHPKRRAVRIEVEPVSEGAEPPPARQAGVFLSGGVDSLATLRVNQMTRPENHPLRMRVCLVCSFEHQARDFEHAVRQRAQAVGNVTRELGVELIPIWSNVRVLEDSMDFWIHEFHGAVLAAVAHTLDRRLHVVSIASTYDVPHMAPWGSHPLLDPHYSSEALRIRHDGERLSRFEKTRIITEWPTGLRNLQVCKPSGEALNCGQCEKCVRTMLALEALGVLEDTPAFPKVNLAETLARNVWLSNAYQASCYADLIGPLQQRGRRDLADLVRRKLARYQFDTFDQEHLGQTVFRTKRFLKTVLRRCGVFASCA